MSTTGGTGRNRRRRGRRGQRSRQEAQQQQPQEQQATQPEREASAEPAAEARPAERQQAADNRRSGSEQQDDRKGGGRKRSRGRRSRTTKRPALAAQPTEVLKPKVRDLPVTGTMMMRTVADAETPGGLTFGCPMLTRTRMSMPFAEGRRMPRCSMGWALHNEEEASFCMRTPDLLDCWKEHPEREAELRGASERENAAD